MIQKKRKTSSQFIVRKETQLLDFIMEQLDGISRNKAKSILQGGGVKVSGVTITQFDEILPIGAKVEISKQKVKRMLKSKWVNLVYEDKDIMVVDKAIGILSMSPFNKQFNVKTVLDSFLERHRSPDKVHVVHRLDRETSGLMVYAKNVKAQQILVDNWQEIVTDRRYVAVVEGQLKGQGVVKSWLKEGPDYLISSSPTDNGGKLAITHYKVLKEGDNCTLVELNLETGRKNQIRVHMQDLGHSICGDTKYGSNADKSKRLCLHAYRLCFYHPITGYLMEFETPIPKMFKLKLKSQNIASDNEK